MSSSDLGVVGDSSLDRSEGYNSVGYLLRDVESSACVAHECSVAQGVVTPSGQVVRPALPASKPNELVVVFFGESES